MRLAEEGIEELQHFVDTLIVIPNQNLFRICNEKTTFADAFRMADNVLHSGVRGVTDLMVMPGLINLDFADIRTIMSEMGKAMMGTGEASGDKRAINAAEAAIANPLLDDVSMHGAKGVLINITGGPDMTLFEVDEAANRVREEVDPDANIVFGSTFDAAMEGAMRVSIVATGIDAEETAMPRPAMISLVHDADRKRRSVSAPVELSAVETSSADELELTQEDTTPPSLIETAVARATSETAAAAAETVAARPAGLAMPGRAAMPLVEPAAPTQAAFIAPKAVEPAVPPTASRVAPTEPRRADPFAEAAMVNAPARDERRRGRSLFQKVTGAVNGLVSDDQVSPTYAAPPRREPAAPTRPNSETMAAPPVQEAAPRSEPPAQPVQPTLGNLDRPEPAASASRDDEMLEIPAFLRRQAN
jgi:cell division protein FtsZ